MIEISHIAKMSTVERLQAIEQLWDALCHETPEIPSPEWHGNVLEERKTRAKRGEARFLTMEQLKMRFHAET
jgi:hypothetical protein